MNPHNANRAAKTRNHAIHHNLALHQQGIQPVPSHATPGTPHPYPGSASTPTVPSSGSGIYMPQMGYQGYNPAPTGDMKAPAYEFIVAGGNNSQYNPAPVAQAGASYAAQQPHQAQYHNYQQQNHTAAVSLFNPIQPVIPNQSFNPWNSGIPPSDELPTDEMPIDEPSLPSPSDRHDSQSPFQLDKSRGTDKRPRDPHRKEIENRAASKRKEAVKRLSQVLADRTHALPENGLANQLHLASEQLEEDARVIKSLERKVRELERENKDLKDQVSQVKTESTSLKKQLVGRR